MVVLLGVILFRVMDMFVMLCKVEQHTKKKPFGLWIRSSINQTGGFETKQPESLFMAMVKLFFCLTIIQLPISNVSCGFILQFELNCEINACAARPVSLVEDAKPILPTLF